MFPTKYILPLATSLVILFVTACGSSEVVFENGEPGRTTSTGRQPSLSANAPHIVHVDMVERVATLRNGSQLKDGFLIALSPEGNKTAALKALAMRGPQALRTADILEGKPQINNKVRPASSAEASELEKIYRDTE